MKKKLLALLMSLTMTAALIGCGSADQTASAETAETTEATVSKKETEKIRSKSCVQKHLEKQKKKLFQE